MIITSKVNKNVTHFFTITNFFIRSYFQIVFYCVILFYILIMYEYGIKYRTKQGLKKNLHAQDFAHLQC